MINEDYLKNLRSRVSKENGSRWGDLVGELTDYLNTERGKYPPVSPKRIGMLVAYIKRAGGYAELEYFIKEVKSKGSWFFWWTVKPKK